ncbi:Cullin-1 [Hondaea fermentalgiana]|uniref:Cullin-1 n=1 Tax=Hondaea fermentalgiana TaxID=2315210 RepID=A0A2R5GEL6_9STRA|nr:Cullin-1 [Hondaea fermentalgiana]|eukprot:GBG26681.1 Cullin-1 [Hondaea fermentalgiana]
MDNEIIKLEEGWAEIDKSIEKLIRILSQENPQESLTRKEYAHVYTKCYTMCTQRSPDNFSQELYTRHGERIKDYLESAVMPVLREKRDEYLLKELVVRWKQHEIMDKWMRRFFMYLDRYHVKHHSLPELHEASLKLFRTIVFQEVKPAFVAAILAQINKERDGEVVDRFLLKQCVDIFGKMMPQLKVYTASLEEPLLADTREMYRKKAQEWIEQDALPEYLRKAEASLETEGERVDNYLEAQTKPRLQGVVMDELLAQHEMALLEKEGSGCRALLRDDKSEDLARLFKLYQKVENGLEPIAAIVKEHVTKQGVEIVKKRETVLASAQSQKEKDAHDPTFVQSLLDLHEKYQSLVKKEFEGDSFFQKALKEAFETFVNQDVGKRSNAELLANFCDRILKTGGVKLSDTEMESLLERTVQLFSYLSEKDTFADVYRNQLAKRLLMNRSASDDAEHSIISKLRLRCGAQFTSKMEGMVKDLLTGNDFKKDFKEQVRTKPEVLVQASLASELSASAPGDLVVIDGVEFTVEVLTTGHWPSYKMVPIELPPELLKCISVYQAFYDNKTSQRCLKWVHSLGNCSVRAQFKRTYDLQVTTLQACALLQFNAVPEDEYISFQDMVTRLNVEEEVAKRILHSLSCAKHRVIEKEPKSKGISRTDKFKFNSSFQSPMRKLRLPMASLDESSNPKRVQEDRSIAIEAAIVRIMKARKRLSHQELVAEVLSQLHFFSPAPRVVKRRIEHLIDREYLERDESQANFYKYLA